jgi:hypothetical protein
VKNTAPGERFLHGLGPVPTVEPLELALQELDPDGEYETLAVLDLEDPRAFHFQPGHLLSFPNAGARLTIAFGIMS